jgi:hypothetical protein
VKRVPLFLPEFWDELTERCVWYESRSPGLGARFASVADAAVDRILEFPEAWAPMQDDIRKYLLQPFRDLLIYRETPDRLFFLGVVHGSRDLGLWLRRRR